ncbi:uncharacterized protein LOC132870722 [Neoarius graeffei]|uniref:uncharacterized protein LOC132870722 n=1 Tax=Neoarius graeffei TaxID=443677 RepID=UPI00298CC41F|nr:uncharacterized protein LOC132870722 [Neoarius graeffei]
MSLVEQGNRVMPLAEQGSGTAPSAEQGSRAMPLTEQGSWHNILSGARKQRNALGRTRRPDQRPWWSKKTGVMSLAEQGSSTLSILSTQNINAADFFSVQEALLEKSRLVWKEMTKNGSMPCAPSENQDGIISNPSFLTEGVTLPPCSTEEVMRTSPYPREDTIMAHSLIIGVTLPPCSAEDITMPPASSSDIVLRMSLHPIASQFLTTAAA